MDFGNYDDRSLPPAERAVKYLLERVRRDPDLRYLMLDTQAFTLLCQAEGFRLAMAEQLEAGTAEAKVEAFYAEPFDHPDAKKTPRLASFHEMRETLEKMVELFADYALTFEDNEVVHNAREILAKGGAS